MKPSTLNSLAGLALIFGLAVAADASATAVVVDAKANTLYMDSGVFTGINLNSGETLKVQVGATDLWAAGGVPRWSDANGLTGDLYATGADESGYAAGVLIGQNYGNLLEDGFLAPVGSLVGKIGSTYKVLGTGFDGVAWGSGELRLYFWDNPSVVYDNKDYITAEITHGFTPVEVDDPPISAVPEPATWALLISGFGMLGVRLRRRSSAVA